MHMHAYFYQATFDQYVFLMEIKLSTHFALLMQRSMEHDFMYALICRFG